MRLGLIILQPLFTNGLLKETEPLSEVIHFESLNIGAAVKKIIFVFWFLLITCYCLAGCSNSSDSNLMPMAEYEGGALFKAGPVNILRLRGTHYQMGRQYGMLLKNELNALYALATAQYNSIGYTNPRMQQIANAYYANFPEKYREVIAGMAETSGLGLEKQILVNGIEIIPKINSIVPHCTGLVAWGDYTGGAPLIFGRNNDDHPFFRNFGGYTVIAVFNPTDGGIPTAIVNYAGVIYAPTGLNRYGIFMEINSGNSPGGFKVDRTPTVVSMFEVLQRCSTQAQVNDAFQNIEVDITSIINVADPSSAYSFEYSLSVMKRRSADQEGLLVSTNHFIDPSWGLIPHEPDSANGWTVARRNNGLAWAESGKGRVSVNQMKEILSKDIITEGGLFSSSTIYQVVAVPQQLILWLRAPDHFDWQKIDLMELFD
jgi:hypothetical protein